MEENTTEETCGLTLELTNFRIDSTGWDVRELDDHNRTRTNPGGDVWEILGGKYSGEQHFTLEAALRETAKVGKRMPTESEWLEMLRTAHDGYCVTTALGLRLAGYRCAPCFISYDQGGYGHYWAHPRAEAPTYGSFLSHATKSFRVNSENFENLRTLAFSVRCLKE